LAAARSLDAEALRLAVAAYARRGESQDEALLARAKAMSGAETMRPLAMRVLRFAGQICYTCTCNKMALTRMPRLLRQRDVEGDRGARLCANVGASRGLADLDEDDG